MAMKTHNELQCDGEACPVHAPSAHHMNTWPLVYRIDQAVPMDNGKVFVLAKRTCEHGVGHPDPDSIAYAKREGGEDFGSAESVHGCDGCCRAVTY